MGIMDNIPIASDILSIIVPIKNEAISKVQDLINYYSSLDFTIYIADSSIKSMNYESNNPSVIYLHLPEMSFSEKIFYASKEIRTQLVLLNPVDDCISLSILKDIILWVDLNNIVYFGGYSKSVLSPIKESQKPISFDSKKIKIVSSFDLFLNYDFPLLWGIYKTNSFSNAFKKISKLKFNNENFYELSLVVILTNVGLIAKYYDTVFFRETRTDSWGSRHKTISLIPNRIYFKDQLKLLSLVNKSHHTFTTLWGYCIYLVLNTLRYLFNLIRK
jgi:hypothetical protein